MKKVKEKSTAGFVLSLIGGIIILLVAMVVPSYIFEATYGNENAMPISFFSGILVITGSIFIYSGRSKVGGIICILCSITAFYGFGGYLIGSLLGIIGGILALVKR